MNAALAVRMCPECGVGFVPVSDRQLYCCQTCRNHCARTTPMDRSVREPCQMCGSLFSPKFRLQKFCSDHCRYKRRYQLERANPEEVAKNKARSRAWYLKNKAEHVKKTTARKNALLRAAPAIRAPVVTVTEPAIDPWSLPSPSLDRLPGGFVTIELSSRKTFEHWQLSALHGVMTSVTGPHLPHEPRFALLPWPSGCGWAAYLSQDGDARAVAGKAHVVRLGSSHVQIRFGSLVRVAPKAYAPGRYRVRIDAVTPVHVRSYGSTVVRIHPSARHMRGTLDGFMPRRLGLTIPPGHIALDLVESDFSESFVQLGGRKEFGMTAGWVGHCIVETNAVGRFLLGCCALGLGYGGKVAFGFGRVRVSDV